MTSFYLLESWLIREAGFWILTRRKEGDIGGNNGAAATAREAQLDAKKLCHSPCPLQSTLRGQHPNRLSTRNDGKRRTTTTNSSSSHHHDSAPSRPHSLICTGAEPIPPVHASSQLGRAAVTPRNEVIFLPFWRVFQTCAFAWFQTHCDILLNLLAGEFSSQTAWLMLCCPISVNQ